MDAVTFRRAEMSDAAAGARLHRECWREAYGPHVDPGLLAARLGDVGRWEQAWVQQLTQGAPRTLAVHGGELIGFAVAGPSRENEQTPLELYALYVRQAWWGTGVGQELLDREIRDEPCTLWVLERNPRARAFYVRNGFVPDGAREYYDALGAWEIRMLRSASR